MEHPVAWTCAVHGWQGNHVGLAVMLEEPKPARLYCQDCLDDVGLCEACITDMIEEDAGTAIGWFDEHLQQLQKVQG